MPDTTGTWPTTFQGLSGDRGQGYTGHGGRVTCDSGQGYTRQRAGLHVTEGRVTWDRVQGGFRVTSDRGQGYT